MSAVNAPGGHAKQTAAERTAATYSISDLAQEFALTTRAIRFYEGEGLLAPRRRGTARIYGERERTRWSPAFRATPARPSTGVSR